MISPSSREHFRRGKQRGQLHTFSPATARNLRILGWIGTAVCIALFVREPSFLTPDKIIVFLTFVGLIFGQATELLKRLLPFVALLVVYESFRGLAHILNTHVHFTFMARFDVWMFHALPTAKLQNWLWHGHVQWYDFVFYITYMLHFVTPIALALLIWKQRDSHYWRFVASYVSLSFAGFITYFVYPAAPPWMASDLGYIQPIKRISSDVWYALGVHDFPSLYNSIAPNPVAAVPSLHAAYSILFALFVYKLFGKRWGAIAALYPLSMCVGVVYQGEHYVFDVILGGLYAFGAYYMVDWYCKRRASRKVTAGA